MINYSSRIKYVRAELVTKIYDVNTHHRLRVCGFLIHIQVLV